MIELDYARKLMRYPNRHGYRRVGTTTMIAVKILDFIIDGEPRDVIFWQVPRWQWGMHAFEVMDRLLHEHSISHAHNHNAGCINIDLGTKQTKIQVLVIEKRLSERNEKTRGLQSYRLFGLEEWDKWVGDWWDNTNRVNENWFYRPDRPDDFWEK